MANRIQLRRDTTANWENINPILADGEPGYDIVTNEVRIGDGSTAWTGLTANTISGGGGTGTSLTNNGYTFSLETDGNLTLANVGYINAASTVAFGNASNVIITAGSTTGCSSVGGSVILNAGSGGNDGTDHSGNVLINTRLGSWRFGADGNLTLPKGLQTSSSETLNLFTNYSSGDINIGGISPTINMGGQVNIGYLNTKIVFGYSGVLTAGTSFTNFTGTPASNGTWTTAIATGTNGNGGPQNGVPVSFTVHGAFGVYNSVEPNFYGQGQNYAVGDTITIAGTQLGGTSPANDLTFTIAGEVGNTYPNLGPGSLVFDYGLGQFFGYTQNTYGTQAYPLWRQLDNTSASSLVNGSYTVSLGTDGNLTLPAGGNISYSPETAGSWAGTAPTTIQQAIDRIAAVVKVLNSGTGA